jgi:hypothetical protein
MQYVRPYVRRNKTDRTDTEGRLEAARCAGMHAVPVKTVEQQTIQALHRVRTQWQATRTNRINVVRGRLREQGLPVPVGARKVRERVSTILEDADQPVPGLVRHTVAGLVDEIRALERRVHVANHTAPLDTVAGLDGGHRRATGPQQSGHRGRQPAGPHHLGRPAPRGRLSSAAGDEGRVIQLEALT